MHILSPETDNCPSWISGRERMTVENISWSISTKECCRPRRGLNPRPPGLQSDGASNWTTGAGIIIQERFYKLTYDINTIIKCGIWQPVKYQLVSLSWTVSKMKWFFIVSVNWCCQQVKWPPQKISSPAEDRWYTVYTTNNNGTDQTAHSAPARISGQSCAK